MITLSTNIFKSNAQTIRSYYMRRWFVRFLPFFLLLLTIAIILSLIDIRYGIAIFMLWAVLSPMVRIMVLHHILGKTPMINAPHSFEIDSSETLTITTYKELFEPNHQGSAMIRYNERSFPAGSYAFSKVSTDSFLITVDDEAFFIPVQEINQSSERVDAC